MADGKTYIVIRGERAQRVAGGIREILMPVVCSHGDGSFRLALEDENRKYYVGEGKAMERRLISAYRGMKIAECLLEFKEVKYLLDSCLMAGRNDRYISKEWMKRVRPIESQIGREERKKILTLVPENLDRVIESLEDAGVNFDKKEILEEFQSKNIVYTPKVGEVLDAVVAEIVSKK